MIIPECTRGCAQFINEHRGKTINRSVPMLIRGDSIEEVKKNFDWEIPEFYNMGVDVCDRWAATDPDRTAIIYDSESGIENISYADLFKQSNQLANFLVDIGIHSQDRIGILLPQNPWTAVSTSQRGKWRPFPFLCLLCLALRH